LQDRRPKDIAPLFFAKFARKKRTVVQALHDNNWIRDLNFRSGMTTAHILEYTSLWSLSTAQAYNLSTRTPSLGLRRRTANTPRPRPIGHSSVNFLLPPHWP
jgi:hypothetical protein